MARLFAILFALCLTGLTWAAPSFPPLTGRVVDDAHLLTSSQTAEITGALAAIEQQTTTQIVVVTLPSLQGYDIAEYGYQLGRTWGIGQQGRNNGVLLIVAPQEKKVRIEVGYGLEGELTDAISSVIIQQAILPAFRNNNYAQGINQGLSAITQVLTSQGLDQWSALARETANTPQKSDFKDPQLYFLLAFFVFSFFIMPFTISTILRPTPRAILIGIGLAWLVNWAQRVKDNSNRYTNGRDDDFWGGGGGWGGGTGRSSGGGFFSGGGGSFGGGGASGGW